jgi:DNA-binding transcriptional LysR family regulator
LGKEKLGDIDDQVDWVISKGKNLKGMIRIGLLQDYSTPFPLFTILAEFRKKYPNISFEVTFATGARLEQMLLENKLDLGLLSNFEQRSLFVTSQVSTANHLLATSREYLESKGPFHTIDTVLEADLIDLDINFITLRGWMKKNIESRIGDLIRKVPAITTPNHLATKEILEAGFGIAVLPEYLIEKPLKKGEILRVLPQMKELIVWLDIAYRKPRKLQLFEKVFVEYIQEYSR